MSFMHDPGRLGIERTVYCMYGASWSLVMGICWALVLA